MKLTKTFCDICKEEVPDYLHQSVELSGHVDMCSGACDSVKLEVCRQCGVEFFQLLQKMKDSAANTLGMGDTAHNSQSDAICPHFKVEKYLGSDGWIEVNKCIVAGKLTHI